MFSEEAIVLHSNMPLNLGRKEEKISIDKLKEMIGDNKFKYSDDLYPNKEIL